MPEEKIGINQLNKQMEDGEKLVMVAVYDYPSARLVDRAGVDMVLVGASLGNVVLGYDTAIPVDMAAMLHHLKAVDRGIERAMIIADMPFGSYQVNTDEAIRNAIRLIQEGGADAVKLEGGTAVAPLVSELTKRGIPVMGHIGLLPQTACLWGHHHSHGRDEDSAWELVEDAQALEEAGAFCVLLECVTAEVAQLITEKVDIPTIGIGSGSETDGQLLIYNDLLGMNDGKVPRFVKRYANLADTIEQAVSQFAAEVRSGVFPAEVHSFPMDEDEARKLY